MTQSEITGVTFNGDGDTGAMVSASIFSSCGFVVIAFLFSVLRAFIPAVYNRAPLAEGHEEGSKSSGQFIWRLCDWFWLTTSTKTEDEVRSAGLDGWALLEFHRLNLRIIMRVAPVVLAVLCPLHFIASNQPGNSRDFISRLDIANLPDGSWEWWIHVGIVWFVVGVSTCYIRIAHEEFLERRLRWLQDLPSPQVKTVMVENIPEELRSDRHLVEYFERIFGVGCVERAYLVRRSQDLRSKVDDFEVAKYKLMVSKQRWQKAGCPEDWGDNLDLMRSNLVRLGEQVVAERTTIEDVCRGRGSSERSEGDKLKYCSPCGFVTFNELLTQRLASGEQYRKDVTEMTVGPAPDPNDVLYDDLVQDRQSGHGREFLGWASLIAIFVSWSPIIVFISSFTTLTTLEEYVPFVRDLCTKSPRFASFLEGVLATAALKLFLAFLPSILLGIVRKFFLLKSGAWAQIRLERWYFSFLTIFVLLVTILGRSIIITVAIVVQKPGEIMDMMARSLPGASHFYFDYFILGWLQHAWEMVRFTNLFRYWIARVIHQLPSEMAKERCEPEDPAVHGMGTRMAYSALMAAISFVFCSCSPLIMVFSCIYFASARIVYGYLVVRVEGKKPDLGGRFWIEGLNQVFSSLVIYILLMTGVLGAHGGAELSSFRRWLKAILTFLSLLALHWQWRRVNDLAWEYLPLQTLAEAQGKSTPAEQVGEYVQPEFVSSVEVEELGKQKQET